MTHANTTDLLEEHLQSDQEKWKTGMITFFRDLGFTHALTLAWNHSYPLAIAKSHLRTLHAIVDQRLFGCRYVSKPSGQRTLAVFVVEGHEPGGHLHVHSLWRVSDPRHLVRYMQLFPSERGGVWNRIVASGSYKLAINDDPWTFAAYALKNQHKSSPTDQIIWSSEFLAST